MRDRSCWRRTACVSLSPSALVLAACSGIVGITDLPYPSDAATEGSGSSGGSTLTMTEAGGVPDASGVAPDNDGSSRESESAGVSVGDGSVGGAGLGDGGLSDASDAGGDGPCVLGALTVLWDFDDGGLGGWGIAASPSDVLETFLSAQALPSIDTATGYPANPPGSMTMAIPFTAYDQQADYEQLSIPPVAVDLSHSLISMWAKLDMGFTSSVPAPGGLVMYIKTGAGYVYGASPYDNIELGDTAWHEYTFDVKNGLAYVTPDAGFDPTDVMAIGFRFDTGYGTVAPGEVSPYPPPTPATFHVDRIGIQTCQ